MREGKFEVVVYFPAGLRQLLCPLSSIAARRAGRRGRRTADADIEVYPNLAAIRRKPCIARDEVLARCETRLGSRICGIAALPSAGGRLILPRTTWPEPAQHKAALWSKILPFVLLIWALTGGFYPAIDLLRRRKSAARWRRCSRPGERCDRVGQTADRDPVQRGDVGVERAQPGIDRRHVLSGMPNFGAPARCDLWAAGGLVANGALFLGLSLALASFARSSTRRTILT